MIGAIILALVVASGPASGQQGCNTKVDVTFLLDSSDNVGKDNFQKQLAFVKDSVSKMNIAPDKVQASVVTYSTGVDNQFYLNQYRNKSDVQNAIARIPYKGGSTHTSEAIRFATGTSFSPLHGGRSDASHVAIVVTNGPSGAIDLTKLEAQTARDNGVILYSVGVGSGVDMNELKAIASDPDSRHLFTAQNYDALHSLSDLLATKVCNELPPDPTALAAPTGCLQKADLVFMVDSSSSVGSTNFQKLEHFLKDVVAKVDVAPNKVQVGIVKYGSYPSIEFPLGAYKTRPEVMKAIERMTYLGGGTNDADAISYTGQQVFSQTSGARGNVPRIAVLITDGGSANPSAAINAANKARTEHIGMMTVGVGNRINAHELNSIADGSADAFTVSSYDNLDSITDQLINQMCKVRATEPSLTTSAPGASLPPDTCQDRIGNCGQYGSQVCRDYQTWAHDNCQKTCGICTPLYTAGPPKCQDNLPSCSSYGKDNCKNLPTWARANCPLFCGFCGTNTTAAGYYGQCFYKGVAYKTGDKWYDGCDYECVCEDGNSGKYKCNNRCPVYHNLPRDCTLVAQPGQCCLAPVCNFAPTVDSQKSNGHGKTQDGIDVCVYKSKQYFQGQSWRDGCDYQCRCVDSKTGLYQCEDLCPSYNSIPPYCHLEQKAGDCCSRPVCEFDSQTGSFQGSGSISGNGVGATPTAHPPCIDVINTCSQYGKSVCTAYRGWAATNCRKYCDLCPTGLPKPGPTDQCIYGGNFYNQGDHWNTSCSTQCTCENAIYGYYRCVDTCPTYNNLPNGCTMVKNAGDCCPTAQCSNGYFLTSSPNLGSIGNGGQLSVSNPPNGMVQVRPTLTTGTQLTPGTGGTGFQAPSLTGCLFKGQLYVQNQVWEDGCDYTCTCTQAYSGLYTCRQKCPTYPLLQPSCTLVPDTNDVCCKTPKCSPDPVTHKIPVPIPVFQAAISSHGSVQPPNNQNPGGSGQYSRTVYLAQTGLTPAPPTAPSSGFGTGGIGHCTYKNVQYQQGQTWEDGCQFNCVCDDASKGHYHCVEKCVHYNNLPDSCYLEKDPANPCCDRPKCVFPVNYVTDVGQVRTTPGPRGEHCVYNGQDYQQGQTWYDGCSYKCTCEDAINNIYRCLTRCPQYTNIAGNCEFAPDPKDPSCCQMPECYGTGTINTTSGNQLPTPAPSGTYVGQGIGLGYCEYKGVHYSQGQKWQDGCDLNCECTDADTGLYRCSDSCPRWVNLPTYCTLITDFANPCCKKPRCNFPSNPGQVTGAQLPSTPAPTPLAPGATPVPGQTFAPTLKVCIYKGVKYSQGQTWDDGCQYKCRCDDADKGLYTCNERCASYQTKAGCTMVTDPDDSCCLVPSCIPTAGPPTIAPSPGVSTPSPTPYRIPTVAPGQITGSANVPTPRPGSGLPTPAPLTYCVYKGQQYSQGQTWDDGCQFTCECVDAHIGQYKCLEKCTKYVNLPSNCRLAKDPTNPCCQVPECSSTPYIAPTPAPTGYQSPTPAPQPHNVCVYKGVQYTQGQTWYDGCDYVCDCENSGTGLYRCNNRCPSYSSPLPAECKLEPSSKDPLCCKEPKCTFIPHTNQTTGFVPVPTPPPGVIDGGVATPTPGPTLKPSPGYQPTVAPSVGPKVCVYKGNQYQQGQKWKDGCLYNCECLDALSGHYQCTEMCPKYDNLPAGCRLISDYNNPCCKKAYCDVSKIPTPAPFGSPTPAPTPKSKTGCNYNNVMFKQGEQWNDGCDLKCVCEDETTGFYRCSDRCAKFNPPEYCSLVTDPRDSCCKVPYCDAVTPTPQPWRPGMVPTPAPGVTFGPGKIPTPAPGLTYAPGMYPTWVPGMVPTPAPGMTFAPNKIPTPAPGRTYAPGMYPTWVPGMVPTPAPGMTFAPNKVPTPGPGRTYAPGMYPTWVPGMVPTPAPGFTFAPNKVPTPAPGSTYAPGMYPTWVPGMVPTPAPGYTFAPNKIPTPGPGRTYAPGMYPTWVPGMVPTPAPGFTYAPNKLPTPAPGMTYAPGMYPTWVPGMKPTPAPGYTYPPWLVPTPAPGQTYAPGKFPVPTTTQYPTPGPGLTYPPYRPGMIPTPAPGKTYAPNLIPTPAPGKTYAPGQFPTWVPGMVPTVRPGITVPPWLIPTPAPGSTYPPFHYPTWVPGMIPTPAPGVTFSPERIPTPAPYRTYAPGLYPTWVPGMVPTPAPGMTYAPNKIPTPGPGRTYAPGLFPTWIPGQVPTPAPGVTYAPDKIPTPGPGRTYAPGMFPTWVPGMVPTPAPGVTYAPNKIPTPSPGRTYAPGMYPTWVPGMIPTPAPGSTYAPDKIPTPGPHRTYAPGMYPTWVPGMVPTPAPGMTYAPGKIPTPAPGSTYKPGMYPTWVPGMVPTPAPDVTYAPNKIPTPGPGRTYAPGMYPTWVPGMVPTPAPGMTYAPNKIPTPGPGRTYAPGMYPTWVPGMVPTPAPGVTYAPNKIPTPAPGSTYAPGMYPTWVPGMKPTPAPGYTYPPWLEPTPAPGQTYAPGKFPVPTTTQYPTPGPGLTYPPYKPGMIPTPAPGKTYAPNLIPTPAPGSTYAPGKFPTWVPGMVPTVRPGITVPPWLIPTPAPGSTYPPFHYPTWVPGMIPTPAPGVTFAPDKVPTPAPGRTYAPGLFPTWAPGMIPTPAPGMTYAPNKIPTPGPGRTYAPGMFPTWVPGMVPTPAPGVTYAPNKIPTPGPGRTYAPGMYPTWVPGMVPTPAPGMTYAPNKIPTPGPGRTYAPGMYPTYVPGMIPTPAPGQTFAPNKLPTPAPGSTYAPGMYPTFIPGLMVPTPAPGVTFGPDKVPTPGPGRTYAPGMYPTWVPGMIPTPAPGATFAPDKIPTPGPGRTYAPGMYPTWVPGMVPTPAPGQTYAPNKVPTPGPGRTYAPGMYPTWVPGMVPTPAPGVTYAPDKIPTPGPGRTYAPGMYPTWVPGMVPTPAPGMTYAPDKIPTPGPWRTYAPGMYPTWVPGMVPTPAPGVTYAPNKIPTPAPGSTYAPGMYPTWVPGMKPTPAPGYTYPPWLVPTPAPGQTYAPGKFPVPTTTQYPTPGPGLTYPPYRPGMIPTPAPGKTYAPNLIPTPAPGKTYAPGKFPTWVPGMVPTVRPGITVPPWLIPTPAPGSTYPPFHYPTWVPGMIPTPAPGVTFAPNKVPTPAPFRTYAPGLYPTWVPGMVPTPAPGMTYAPNKIPTPGPGRTYAPGMYPTWVPGMVPTPAPGMTYAPNKIPTPGPGRTYAPGMYPTWVPGMVPTPAPGMTYAPNKIPTPGPGRTYAPGMYPTWVPGMVPTPAPGMTFAPDKIPTPYPGLTYPPGMYPTWVPGMVPTPAPGQTYAPDKIPTPGPGLTYAPGMFPVPTPATPAPQVTPYPIPTAIPGQIEGNAISPNKSVFGCMYHGIVYGQDQKWRDGCQYDCECIDDHTGRYRCKERCPLFLNVPSYCRLVVDPNDSCCKTPVCNPPTPIPQPTPFNIPTAQPQPGVSTQTPPLNPTPGPSAVPTPQPKNNVCVMDGKQYVAGQTWYNGCQQQCVCEDGTTGFYRCYDRCKKYTNVPSSCTMVADPKDPTCCEVPQCIPVPVPGVTITPGPPVIVTGVTGIITGTNPPTVAPPSGQTPIPRNVCVYGGRTYQQGQKWQDGCQYDCICEDGMTGKYQCSERCAKFPFVPPQCKMQRDPKDVCCFVPVCDYNQTVPTLAPFATPGPSPSPGVSTFAPNTLPPSFCVYNGVPFFKGQTWDDGCQKKCRCDDADQNIITCFDRCASFNNIGGNCVMVSDPKDSCCQIPKCTVIPTPGPTPTPRPGFSNPTPGPTPQPFPVPTAPTGSISGGPQPNPVTGLVPTNQGYCEYKGVHYQKGQTWDDGCSYTCDCIDDMSGKWQCNEKCPRYVQIPSYCQMVQDPANKCCRKPYCPTPSVAPTPGPSGVPTPAPKPKDVCVMDGKQYTQGQKWYQGCEKICICNDGKTGAYTCTERCPSYNPQPGCIMVPDPRDPICCQAPQCSSVNVTGVTGAITGFGTPPAPTAGPTPSPGGPTAAPTPQPPKVCVYNGKSYAQGQRWQDGCQYDCECLDAMTGQYRCTDRCPRYPNLPATCHLEYNPADPCCQKPVCQGQTPTPRPGVSPTPGPFPTPSTTDVCVYQGVVFRQGQSINRGCDQICICEDGKTGKISCSERCKTYPPLGNNCTLVTDPNDQCCQVPSCVNPNTNNPNQIVTGVVGTITGSRLPDNNPYTGGTRNVCIYKGQTYQQSQTWDDGCTYTCECIDSNLGKYRCTEKCPSYPSLPSYCHLIQDPVNTCCRKPFCTPPVNPTPMPSPGTGPTPTPGLTPTPKNVCVYNGNMYVQNQQWYDGCNAICRCEDADNNVYRCQQRCSVYSSIQPGCTLVPDPQDPTCCEIPDCPIVPPVSPTPGVITYRPGPGGVVTGIGLVPTPKPGVSPSPGPRKGCLYKGRVFQKGQKFDDGCDYECECLDDNTGRYQCSEKCTKYSALPKQCVLIQDKNKPCCQVPYCDFTNPTPFPGGIPTPAPGVVPTPGPGVITVAPYVVPSFTAISGPSPSPGAIPTPAPQGFCVYKGVYYTQGQTWDDGCSKKCRCEDVVKGYYTCSERCASYNNVPSSCILRTDPNDACCLVPDCNSHIPTPRPAPLSTLPPGVSTTPAPVIKPTPITGSFTGSSGGNPINVPYQPGQTISGSSAACVYKGVVYNQGQTWQDGCNYNCECIDSQRGQYRCTDRCPVYVYLPPQCHYKQSPTDRCCRVAECDTVVKPTTKAPVTPAPQTTAPIQITVPTSTKCVYLNGQQYAKGATWTDSCSTCECKDPATNNFLCTNKCPAYSGLPSFCTLVTDPSDRCCMKPKCSSPGGVSLTPYIGGGTSGSATPPTSLQVLPVGTHQIIIGYGPPQGSSGQRNQCVYKGSVHSQGQSWDDGCKYVCTCENATTGMYRCLTKCPAYPSLPSYCRTINVPGQCCPSVTCDIPGYGTYNPVPQLTPGPVPTIPPGGSTPNPQIIAVPNPGTTTTGGGFPGGGYYLPNATNPTVIGTLRDKCVYKSRLYNQGDKWDDGCDYKCECLDGRTGYYQCKPLCPVYNNLPSKQCYLVKAQGQCCSQPMCYDPAVGHAVNPITSTSVFPVVGTYSGGFTGFRPGYPTSGSGTSGSSNVCVYKGTVYHKGDKWDDACDFSCTCLDDTTGLYQCDAKCPTYTQIPPLCSLQTVPGDCCKKVVCQPHTATLPPGYSQVTPPAVTPSTAPSGNCTDRISNCQQYGQSICSNTAYQSWAKRNCQAFCRIGCQPAPTTPAVCQDKLNCATYTQSVCSGIYEPWAKDNCRQYCGFCPAQGVSTSPTPVITTAGAQCVDNYPDCPSLGSFYCTDTYRTWSMQNCRKYCNWCNRTNASPTPATTTINPYSWMLFLKGVAGAPGPDLYQLWHSGQTLNPTNPIAKHLTTEFNGHYKPDYSNHWPDYCIDQVKVSIYNHGIEKAWIIFDAKGADKMSWFSPNRIISSSYSDLNTTRAQVFSMAGDPGKGMEFLISGHSSSTAPCDSYGWMMISTKSTCNFEKGDPKPSFYYAPGTTQAHWGFTNPGSGDVFTIQAHPTCGTYTQSTSQTYTTSTPVCRYKGKTYVQDEVWQDGCDYNCTCDDAFTGYYRCRGLCPSYTMLPPDCHLVTVPGQCCPNLVCASVTPPTAAPPTVVPGVFCKYKGQFYTKGQTWSDGCDATCKCNGNGFYSCGSVCLNWQSIPSQCWMETAPPGLCCEQPTCPDSVNVIFNIPMTYKGQYPQSHNIVYVNSPT